MIEGLLTAAGALAVLGLAWGMASLVESYQQQSKQTRRLQALLGDVAAAIKHSQPTWEQILDMAESAGVGVRETYNLIRQLLHGILTGKDPELEPHKELITGYVNRHKQAEPFEGLPTETRVHLERLREALDGREDLLSPLTSQIRELVSVYEREKRSQRRYTAWGFFLGVLGILFAAYTYFNPLAGASANEKATPKVEGTPSAGEGK